MQIAFPEIQDFYECILLDDTKSSHEKTVETMHMASKLEKEAAALSDSHVKPDV